MRCHLCGTEAVGDSSSRREPDEAGEICCAMCGRVIELIPQSPGVRKYNLSVRDLVGWPQERVLATLGPPDARYVGRRWPSKPGMKEYPYSVMANRDGQLQIDGGYGPRQNEIPFPTPYEEWHYQMKDSPKDSPAAGKATWILYLTGPERSAGEAKAKPEPSVWEKLAGTMPQRFSEESLKPKGPLTVVEVGRTMPGIQY